jgi:hypothetical protein
VRYSFHGKVRATGQQVDGYVEAETSGEAIDRLADQGIIGVYSVRAEPKQPRQSVLLAGTPEFERSQFADPDQPRKGRRALPAPPPEPVYAPPPQLAAPAPAVAPVPAVVGSVTDATMLMLVEKLTSLITHVQKVLDRPAQVVYASGPAREGGGKGGAKRAPRAISDSQNSTLKDIFQNNLDLRRSLAKLAETVTPEAAPVTNGTAAVAAAAQSASMAAGGSEEDPPPHGGASPTTFDTVAASEPTAHGDAASDDDGRDMPLRVHDADRSRQAQPAA